MDKNFKVDSWEKVCIIFDDWASDIEFIPAIQLDEDMIIRYKALLYVLKEKIKERDEKIK